MRAFAVAAVLMFHAFPARLPGGFIGVDVFFVLSGYLITGIILADLHRDAFSFASFYARRIRRIFPSLSLILAFCLLAGWFFLFPQEWRTLSENVLAGAGFYSNILSARESGYFADDAQRQPLLHLWSLGIEEQFYLFWPLTLFGLRKWPRCVLGATLALAAASFLWNLSYAGRNPTLAFYHPAARLWELLAGAALAWLLLNRGEIKRRTVNEVFSFTGLLLLAAGLCWIDGAKPFPGWLALLPVAGTVLLIASGSETWLNRRVLSSRPAVFVGLISYPLYLWHWPLLVFGRLLNESEYHLSPRRVAVAGLALAFLLAWLTYRLWETPMRFSTSLSSAARVRLLLLSMIVVAAVAFVSPRSIAPRLSSPATRELDALEADGVFCETYMMQPFFAREFPSHGKNVTLFVGDSNMAQYEPRIQAVLRANPNRATAVFATSGRCLPLPGLNTSLPGFRCPAFYDYWVALAREPRFSTVAIAASWSGYPISSLSTAKGVPPTQQDLDRAWNGLAATLRSLRESGKRVVVVGSIPVYYAFDPKNGLGRLHSPVIWRIPSVPRSRIESGLAEVNSRVSSLARDSGAEILWPADTLCPGGLCPGLDSAGSPIYLNYYHLRASASAVLARFMDDLVRPSAP